MKPKNRYSDGIFESETKDSLVDQLLDAAESAPKEQEPQTLVGPHSGRLVEVEEDKDGEDTLKIRAPSGEVELAIRLTPKGPVLQLKGASIELETTGRIAMTCDDFVVSAKKGVEIESGGDLNEKVKGNRQVEVGGHSKVAAKSAAIEAKDGRVDIDATDDISVQGKLIFLN